MFVSEVEPVGNSMVECRLCEKFELIYGTSIDAIIAALLGLGKIVDEVARGKAQCRPRRREGLPACGCQLVYLPGCRRCDEIN
jgi:hypothetical protein